MKNRPAKRSVDRAAILLSCRSYLDMGMAEIDPRLAELLVRIPLANSVKGLALEQRKLQRYLVGDVNPHRR